MLDDLPVALRWIVIGGMGAAVLVSAVRVGRAHRPRVGYGIYVDNRESDAGHVVMLTAMLVMFLAAPGVVPNALWQIVFGLVAGAYAVLIGIHIARRDSTGDTQNALAAAGYHLVSALAMLYTTLGAQHMSTMPGMHHGMHHQAAPPFPAIGWMLAGLFVLDAIGLLAIAVTLRAPGLVTEKLPTSLRVAAFPHLTMDVAMALMLVLTLEPML